MIALLLSMVVVPNLPETIRLYRTKSDAARYCDGVENVVWLDVLEESYFVTANHRTDYGLNLAFGCVKDARRFGYRVKPP